MEDLERTANLVPVKELECENCKVTSELDDPIRMSGAECNQPTPCICWVCPLCGYPNLTPDDLSILDADILI